jgi:Flp pilus assembly protein TadG
VPRSTERGATAVEFAVALPIFLAMTLGMVEASRMIVSKTMLAYAVTAGARAASAKYNHNATPSTLSTSDVQSVVIAAAPMLNLTASNFDSITSSATWASRTHGDTVTVQAHYTFTPAFVAGSPVLVSLTSKTFNYTSTMTIP